MNWNKIIFVYGLIGLTISLSLLGYMFVVNTTETEYYVPQNYIDRWNECSIVEEQYQDDCKIYYGIRTWESQEQYYMRYQRLKQTFGLYDALFVMLFILLHFMTTLAYYNDRKSFFVKKSLKDGDNSG
jgi:hypothetical protein